MVAKINFFATQVDSHDNVIHFLGAVLENSACKQVFNNLQWVL